MLRVSVFAPHAISRRVGNTQSTFSPLRLFHLIVRLIAFVCVRVLCYIYCIYCMYCICAFVYVCMCVQSNAYLVVCMFVRTIYCVCVRWKIKRTQFLSTSFVPVLFVPPSPVVLVTVAVAQFVYFAFYITFTAIYVHTAILISIYKHSHGYVFSRSAVSVSVCVRVFAFAWPACCFYAFFARLIGWLAEFDFYSPSSECI